ncbi:hypothetical protein GQ457_06G008870 [Hibiscus cannabinus]
MEGKLIELSLDDSVEEKNVTKLEEESDNEILVRKLQELEGFEMVLGHALMTALGTITVEFVKSVFGFKLDEVKHQWQGEIDASPLMVQYHLWLSVETRGDNVTLDVELQGFLDHFNEIFTKSKGLLFVQETNYSFLFDPGGKAKNTSTKLQAQFKVNSSTTTIKLFKKLCSTLPKNGVWTYMNEVVEVDDPFIFRLLVMGSNIVVTNNNKDFTEPGIVIERSVKSRDVEVNRIMSMYELAKYLADVAFILVVLLGKSDLETYYFGVIVWQQDWVEILPDDQGNKTMPSYVEIKDTKGLISDAAENQIAMILFNNIFNAKKLIGRRYSDVSVQSEVKLRLVKVDINVNEHEEVAQKLLEDFNGVIAFLSGIYQTLPIRDENLRGLQHWNLNGFLAFDYARHFLSCCIRMLSLGYESKGGHIDLDDMDISKALYRREPPTLMDYELESTKNSEVGQALKKRKEISWELNISFARAQVQRKTQAGEKQMYSTLEEGRWVFVLLQPYRQLSAHLKGQQKTRSKLKPYRGKPTQLATSLSLSWDITTTPRQLLFILEQKIRKLEAREEKHVLVHWDEANGTNETWENEAIFIMSFLTQTLRTSFSLEAGVIL